MTTRVTHSVSLLILATASILLFNSKSKGEDSAYYNVPSMPECNSTMQMQQDGRCIILIDDFEAAFGYASDTESVILYDAAVGGVVRIEGDGADVAVGLTVANLYRYFFDVEDWGLVLEQVPQVRDAYVAVGGDGWRVAGGRLETVADFYDDVGLTTELPSFKVRAESGLAVSTGLVGGNAVQASWGHETGWHASVAIESIGTGQWVHYGPAEESDGSLVSTIGYRDDVISAHSTLVVASVFRDASDRGFLHSGAKIDLGEWRVVGAVLADYGNSALDWSWLASARYQNDLVAFSATAEGHDEYDDSVDLDLLHYTATAEANLTDSVTVGLRSHWYTYTSGEERQLSAFALFEATEWLQLGVEIGRADDDWEDVNYTVLSARTIIAKGIEAAAEATITDFGGYKLELGFEQSLR